MDISKILSFFFINTSENWVKKIFFAMPFTFAGKPLSYQSSCRTKLKKVLGLHNVRVYEILADFTGHLVLPNNHPYLYLLPWRSYMHDNKSNIKLHLRPMENSDTSVLIRLFYVFQLSTCSKQMSFFKYIIIKREKNVYIINKHGKKNRWKSWKKTLVLVYIYHPQTKLTEKEQHQKKIKTKIRKKHRLAYNSNTETYLMQISERKKK